eukprot:4045542-Pyramimonas_sp.AAC.2
MLAGPKGRALGESGVKLDTGSEQGKGLRGVDWTLAVIGTGGPVKRSDIDTMLGDDYTGGAT